MGQYSISANNPKISFAALFVHAHETNIPDSLTQLVDYGTIVLYDADVVLHVDFPDSGRE